MVSQVLLKCFDDMKVVVEFLKLGEISFDGFKFNSYS